MTPRSEPAHPRSPRDALALLRTQLGAPLPESPEAPRWREHECWLWYDGCWESLDTDGHAWYVTSVVTLIERPDLPPVRDAQGGTRVAAMWVSRAIRVTDAQLTTIRQGGVRLVDLWNRTPAEDRRWLIDGDPTPETGRYLGQPGPLPDAWAPAPDATYEGHPDT